MSTEIYNLAVVLLLSLLLMGSFTWFLLAIKLLRLLDHDLPANKPTITVATATTTGSPPLQLAVWPPVPAPERKRGRHAKPRQLKDQDDQPVEKLPEIECIHCQARIKTMPVDTLAGPEASSLVYVCDSCGQKSYLPLED